MKTLTANENDVLTIDHVPFTKTWRPVHHADVVRNLNDNLAELGLQTVKRDYTLSQNGKDMFATWQLDAPLNNGRAGEMIGFRNSMQKHFALGVCSGQSILVCDNMCFSGDFVEHRKHTSGLTEESLFNFLGQAFSTVRGHAQLLAQFFDYLGTIHLPEPNRKVLTYNAMEAGVFPPSKFNQFIECQMEEQEVLLEQDLEADTAQQFHGAVTRLLRETSVNNVQDKTGRLNKLMGWGDAEVMEMLKEAA